MTYRFETDEFFTDAESWRGEIVDNETGFVVCEVWNNGDGGDNFYVWQDVDARWEIEDQAIRNYTGEDDTKGEYYRAVDVVAPMDAWIEELRGTQN